MAKKTTPKKTTVNKPAVKKDTKVEKFRKGGKLGAETGRAQTGGGGKPVRPKKKK